MLHDAGTAPLAPNIKAGAISVSRPWRTAKSDGTRRTVSIRFWRSPEESLMATMFRTPASFATVSGSILSPPHVDGLLYRTTGSEVDSAMRRKWSTTSAWLGVMKYGV